MYRENNDKADKAYKNSSTDVSEMAKIKDKKNNKIIKLTFKKMILIALFILLLICIITSIIFLFNSKQELLQNDKDTIIEDNNTINSTNSTNNTFFQMNEETRIDFAVKFMQEYELLLTFYAKALGYTESPYKSIKINSIALAENDNDKYVLSDFTVIANEKETNFRYGMQASPNMTEADIRLFLTNVSSFKTQKENIYKNIQNNNELIELDINKVQEKFSNEKPISDTVQRNIIRYKEIANSIDFDNLKANEFILVSVSPKVTGNKVEYYGNFKKSNDNIIELPILSSSVRGGLIPNGIYQLKNLGNVYECEFTRNSVNSSIKDNITNINQDNIYVFSNDTNNKYITISFIQKDTYRATYNTCSKYGEIIDITYDTDTEENIYYCKIKVEESNKDYVYKELLNNNTISDIKIE